MAHWDATIDQEVGAFLATSRTLALATVDEQGHPHGCNVQYAIDDALRMVWVSSPNSTHSRHIERDGRVAATVYGHDDRAHNIHGLQLRGTAERLTDPGECNAAWELYTTRFAFVAALPQFRELLQKQAFYRMTPTWARWIDNRKGFGWKVERDLSSNPMPLRTEE
ncbi:MAG: pyridoxamine 5'-phosphate oxidase family protein [Phycisphaeraceae bacterium]